MYKEEAEIYSALSNQVVMKHPGRNYPSSLVQGDSLYILCRQADEACKLLKEKEYGEAYEELNDLRNVLWD